ncbi:MAG: hypothetical protein DI535_12250 [Citrobacter freundii]|nr:MAG: hypothetical protein DI535_12250 [Citrobacter freundii]
MNLMGVTLPVIQDKKKAFPVRLPDDSPYTRKQFARSAPKIGEERKGSLFKDCPTTTRFYISKYINN